MNKKLRQQVYEKFNGLCAYTGTQLKDDWQVDHVDPKLMYTLGRFGENPDDISNLYPAQKIVNHYKKHFTLEQFRSWYLGNLHERLKKLPKNPRTEKGQKRKAYLLEVAELFGITPEKPFEGKFYFEKIK